MTAKIGGLFAEPEEEKPTYVPAPVSDWQEVPQARFLSWPHGQQMAYCAARDADSSEFADSPDEAAWYLARARGYMERMNAKVL